MSMQRSKWVTNTIVAVLMIVIFFVYLIPMWWIVSTSFKTDAQAFATPPLVFFEPTFAHYIDAFGTRGMIDNFQNSIIIAVCSSLLALILGVPAAYALSRFKFKSRDGIFNWILSTRMAPPILAAIPFFVISRNIGIFDTRFLMITIYILLNLSWVVWMMRSFFNDIPIELDEVSMVDGCNRPMAFFKIILPLSRPGLAGTAVFCMIMAWNEYFFALILTGVNSQTLPSSITSFLTIQGLLLGQMSAAGTVIMLPVLIFCMFMQKHLVRGLTMGAVKG